MEALAYFISRVILMIVPNLFSRYKFTGTEHVPREGGALLLCNHISHFDPPFMSTKLGRRIHFMADKPLLEIPLIGPLLRRAGIFPVDRTKNDIGALKHALKLLKDGKVVGIFPEEGIRQEETSALGGATMPVGTASLWKKTGVPVIPMVIIGSDQLYAWQKFRGLPFCRVFVRVGPALVCDKDATREELRDRIVTAWRELYEGMIRDHQIRADELPKTAQERWGQPKPVR